MKKFPFNPAGLSALLAELYQLSDEALAVEALQIDHAFDSWVAAHFSLTERQLAYLHAIDPKAKKFLAFNGSFAVGNRLPIVLHISGEANGSDEQGKIIWPKSSLSARSGGGSSFAAAGSLTIDIIYEAQ